MSSNIYFFWNFHNFSRINWFYYIFRSFKRNGIIKLKEGDKEHNLIKAGFLSGMGQLVKEVEVVGIHKNVCSIITGQARSQSFRIYSEAMQKKCGGNANIKYA